MSAAIGSPCWCPDGQPTHHTDEVCTTREHWLDVEDSEMDFSEPAKSLCPTCREWKFIGHGPECSECFKKETK